MGVLNACQRTTNFFKSGCSTVRSNCWEVPLNSTEFFFRCVWVRTVTRVISTTCLAPAPLAGQTKEALIAAGTFDECISVETDVEETTVGEAQTNPLFDLIYSSAALFGRMMDDVRKALPVILVAGGGVSFLAGFLWLFFVKSCAGCMVWTTIFLTFAAFVVVTVVAYWKAGILTEDQIDSLASQLNVDSGTELSTQLPSQVSKSDDAVKRRWEYFAYGMTAFCVILLALILWARKTIKIAIGIIKEASVALRSMKSLLVYPIVTFVLSVVLVVYWVFVLAYLASSGTDDISNTAVSSSAFSAAANLLCPYTTDGGGNVVVDTSNPSVNCTEVLAAQVFEPDNAKRYAIAYHLFGLLWTNQLIQGIGIMIVSGAVCKWYFTMDKKVAGRGACRGACRRTFRFHLGSIAFGALLIAIIQFIRAVLAYLDRKSKGMQKRSKLWRCFFKCIQCCLWCFEKWVAGCCVFGCCVWELTHALFCFVLLCFVPLHRCLKFITKFAFVIIALRGESFCTATKQAIMLMLKNAKRLVVVETITTFLFLLGKVFIVLLSGLAAFAAFESVSVGG